MTFTPTFPQTAKFKELYALRAGGGPEVEAPRPGRTPDPGAKIRSLGASWLDNRGTHLGEEPRGVPVGRAAWRRRRGDA